MDDTPGEAELFHGYERMLAELEQAEKSRAAGNEGKARVCARRAAGIAAGEYLQQLGLPNPGPSAYDRLRYLHEIPGLPESVREATAHLLERVTPEFTLQTQADLIAEARWLAVELLGSLPIGMPSVGKQNSHPSTLNDHGLQSQASQEFSMPQNYIHFNDVTAEIPEVPSNSILSRTIHTDDQLKVILFRFAVGQELSEHTASVPAIIHILEGEARLTLGTDTFEAKAGTWAHMQPNLPHSIFAHSPTTMLLIMLRK